MKNVLLTTLLTLFAATALAQSGSVSATLVDADTLLDITPAVLAKVNELYAADKAAEK